MTARASWYSPVLYLRCRPAATMEECADSIHNTRSIDTAAPEEVQEGVDFLARLWIRRPETRPLSQEQLHRELGLLTPVPISTREAQAEIKFTPIEGRKLRRGEVDVECASATCDVYPKRIKLFVDEHLDAPPAIFTCRARRVGRTTLRFTVQQDGGQIAAASHPLQVIESHQQPRTGIGTKSQAIPVQDSIPTADLPIPAGEFSLVVRSAAGEGSEFPLVRSAISIGRSQACDLVLPDPRVSRRHAELRLQHQGWVIADLGSSHGTFVNGKRLSGPHRVQPGDKIGLGDSTLRLIEHGPITAPPVPMATAAHSRVGAEVAPASAKPVRAEPSGKAPPRRTTGPSKAALATMLSVLLAAGLGAIVLFGLPVPIQQMRLARQATATISSTLGQPLSTSTPMSAPTPMVDVATRTPNPILLPSVTVLASTPTAVPATATSTPGPTALPSSTRPSNTQVAVLVTATSPPALLQPPSSTITPALLLLTALLWLVILSLLIVVILLVRRRRKR